MKSLNFELDVSLSLRSLMIFPSAPLSASRKFMQVLCFFLQHGPGTVLRNVSGYPCVLTLVYTVKE